MEGGENVNRNEWLAFLRSNDSEAKELLALHPGMKPPDESTLREVMKARWKDPGFRARNAAAVREVLKERWKDPGFRARHAAAVSAAQVRRWAVWRHQRKGDRTSEGGP